ncbi:DUF707 domain-containing protein [Chitinophaga sp.]|uniref:DUF707 domain-containing protein n=1 Tax=Chitinophaga sp. TaxID=1869181 RepID=UPI0031DE795B
MSSRNLLIMPFGNQSPLSGWITDAANRHFEVLLLYYHPQITQPELLQPSAAFRVSHLKDFKWWMIKDLFDQQPELLNGYDRFFFPDDDIVMDKEKINCLFYFFEKADVELAQPALTRNSFKSWKALLQKRLSGIRYMNTVELMCPMMTSEAIRQLLHTFKLTRSGYGIDLLWGEIIRKAAGNKSIAVFDTQPVYHSKPVGRGELYKKVEEPVFAERDRIFNDYHITDQQIHSMALPENSWWQQWKSYRRYRQYAANCKA